MRNLSMQKIKDVIKDFSKLVDTDSNKFTTNMYVEVLRNEKEVVLGGNRNGLIYLALQCLKLADERKKGSHLHLDEDTITNVCDCPLIIRYWTSDKN